MDRRPILAILRAGFALLALAAIAVQLVDLSRTGTLDPVNYFSYFTIQTNIIGIVVFLLGAATWRAERSPTMDLVRGAAVVYLTITFVVFAVLLSGTDVDTAIPWVNTTLHEIFPIVVIVDWLVDPPGGRPAFRRTLVWLAYPLAWTVYVLIRGAIVGRYPYPFLDPANGGYGTVALYVVAIFAFGVVIIAVVGSIGNFLGARRGGLRSTASE